MDEIAKAAKHKAAEGTDESDKRGASPSVAAVVRAEHDSCNVIGRPIQDGKAMALDVGEKIHVIERRRFETDLRRHFFGIVERVTESTIRAVGYVFVYDPGTSTYLRSTQQRTRVIPLASDGLIINVAPEPTLLEAIRYEDNAGRLVVTDGTGFTLDINEFGRNR